MDGLISHHFHQTVPKFVLVLTIANLIFQTSKVSHLKIRILKPKLKLKNWCLREILNYLANGFQKKNLSPLVSTNPQSYIKKTVHHGNKPKSLMLELIKLGHQKLQEMRLWTRGFISMLISNWDLMLKWRKLILNTLTISTAWSHLPKKTELHKFYVQVMLMVISIIGMFRRNEYKIKLKSFKFFYFFIWKR